MYALKILRSSIGIVAVPNKLLDNLPIKVTKSSTFDLTDADIERFQL